MVTLVFIASLKVITSEAEIGTPVALLAGTVDTMTGCAWVRPTSTRGMAKMRTRTIYPATLGLGNRFMCTSSSLNRVLSTSDAQIVRESASGTFPDAGSLTPHAAPRMKAGLPAIASDTSGS